MYSRLFFCGRFFPLLVSSQLRVSWWLWPFSTPHPLHPAVFVSFSPSTGFFRFLLFTFLCQQPPFLPPPALVWLLLLLLLPLSLPEFVISDWEGTGVPVCSPCVSRKLLHDSRVLWWIPLEDSDESSCTVLRGFFGWLGFTRFSKHLCSSSCALEDYTHSFGKQPYAKRQKLILTSPEHFQSKCRNTPHAHQEQVPKCSACLHDGLNENGSQRLVYLNTWPSGGGTIWKD